jgi:glycosyltransferase involved in cell wall biosynthesis
MNPKISFIIPVYNIGEHLLSKCINSCLGQTYTNIEVVAVNDCSPNLEDKLTMERFSKQYPDKFIALFHKKNQRQGIARNTGVDKCTGDYIIFVDSDDYVDTDICTQLVNGLGNEDFDVVYCKEFRQIVGNRSSKWGGATLKTLTKK